MKRIFIMLLITCSAIITYAQQDNKSLAQPTHVIELLNGIIIDFGQTSDQIYSVQKNPNTNQLESSIRIVKFLAENKEWFSEDIGDCFIKDEPVSYQMQHFSPGNKEMFGINVKNINGGPHNHYMVRTSTQQEMWLMCVKNTENPQLRDAYAIVWEKAEDLKVKGTVFMITSIRPDIYTQNYEGNTEMSTVTNVINPNAAIDPLLKMSRQDDEAKEWMKSLSPEQLFSVMQMSTTMRTDIMKAAPIYQTLSKLIKDGPAFKARLGIYADKYAPQIIELNKGIDEFYQEFLKKFKDLQPPTEVMNQVNTQTYKEMLQYLTEQNKLFNEIYRVRGSLPKKAQKAQKHVNELTEKYMKELNKLVMERN